MTDPIDLARAALDDIATAARSRDFFTLSERTASLVQSVRAREADPARRLLVWLRAVDSAVGQLDPSLRSDERVRVGDRSMYRAEAMAPTLNILVAPLVSDASLAGGDGPARAFDAIWPAFRRGFFDRTREQGAELLALAIDDASGAHMLHALCALPESWKNPRVRAVVLALAARMQDPDALRAAMPTRATWSERMLLVTALEARGRHGEALEVLRAQKPNPARDAAIARIVAASPAAPARSPEGNEALDEALSGARIAPSQLPALAQRFSMDEDAILTRALAVTKLESDPAWLAELARRARWTDLVALAKKSHPLDLLDVIERAPKEVARELSAITLERVFHQRVAWVDEHKARLFVGRALRATLDHADDAKQRAKALAKARSLANRVAAKNTDWFTRELARELSDAVTQLDR
jgi:hypothetical protein